MDDFTIDQGTVIYGIRSSKYPTVCCYGVIITARCDIAQGKVPKATPHKCRNPHYTTGSE